MIRSERVALAICALLGWSMPAEAARSVFHVHLHVATISGHTIRILNGLGLKINCSMVGMATIHIVSPPGHGWAAQSTDAIYPGYQPPDPRAKCPSIRRSGPVESYTPSTTYIGRDFLAAELAYPDGQIVEVKLEIDVR